MATRHRTATPTDHRSYMLGHKRARASYGSRMQRILQVAKRYRDLARLGAPDVKHTCATCFRWTRGAPATLWGQCSQQHDDMYGAEPRILQTEQLVTNEEFGCVNWLPKTITKENRP